MLRGAVALVVRGSCSFVRKVGLMEAAGAIGVVVANLEGGREIFMMSRDEASLVEPTIPAVMVPQEDGQFLRWWAERRPVVVSLVQGAAEGDVSALAVGPLNGSAQGQERTPGRRQLTGGQRQQQKEKKVQQQQRQQQKEAEKDTSVQELAQAALGVPLPSSSLSGSSSGSKQPQQLQQRRVWRPRQQRARRWQKHIQASRARQQQQLQQQPSALDLTNTRVEISVPLTTQAWLAANVWSKGITTEALYQFLGQQPQLMFALLGEAKRAHKQQLLAERRRKKKL
jgi:hypothetical protein